MIVIFLPKLTKLANLTPKAFRAYKNNVVGDGRDRANEIVVNLFNQFKSDKSRNLTHMSNMKTIKKFTFVTTDAKKTFDYL